MKSKVNFKCSFAEWAEDAFAEEGILAGILTLKIHNKIIIDSHIGFNNSVISIIGSGLTDHKAVKNESEANKTKNPMFFCAGDFDNKCGCVSDFSVLHKKDKIIITDFYNCKVLSNTKLELDWIDWAKAVESFGKKVLQNCPEKNVHINNDCLEIYQKYRERLEQELLTIQKALKNKRAT